MESMMDLHPASSLANFISAVLAASALTVLKYSGSTLTDLGHSSPAFYSSSSARGSNAKNAIATLNIKLRKIRQMPPFYTAKVAMRQVYAATASLLSKFIDEN